MLDIFKTHYLLQAVETLPPVTTFLRDRYFPTNEATDIFATDDVLVEYYDGNRKVAPFVAPRQKGITIMRKASYMERYTPPLVAPRRTLTLDDLARRGFGEALLSELTPQQRQATMIMRDMDEMSAMIARREEAMAAEVLTTNGCVMKHYADDLDVVAEEKTIMFYEGSSNPASYTPDTKWGEAGADIFGDIYAMGQMLAKRGLPYSDLIVSPDVATVMLNNDTVQAFLDNRRFELGNVQPEELPAGVSRMMVLNVYGRDISVYCYAETYENEAGEDTPFIPAGTAILTAPAAGRTLYGAITQIEQIDGQFHTYRGRRVPKYISDAVKDVRTITLSSAPLLIPNHTNPWISAKVLGE